MTTNFLNQQIYSTTNFFTQTYLYPHAKCEETAQTQKTFKRFIECLEGHWRILNEISHHKGLETLKKIVLQCKQHACCIFRKKISIYREKQGTWFPWCRNLTNKHTNGHFWTEINWIGTYYIVAFFRLNHVLLKYSDNRKTQVNEMKEER